MFIGTQYIEIGIKLVLGSLIRQRNRRYNEVMLVISNE